MAESQIVKNVVEYVVGEIVEESDAVDVTAVEQGPSEVMVEVRTAKPDMGRVIGRRGRVARAIRAVAALAGEEEGLETDVEFVD